jgi:hypothetical protein
VDVEREAMALRRPMGPGTRELVRMATLAGSSHNTQPWRFRLVEHGIEIRPDTGRRCPAVDPDDAHLWRSLGCAAENLVQAASGLGLAAAVFVQELVVRVDLVPAGSVADEPLAAAIRHRQCTRLAYDGRPLEAEALGALEAAAKVDGARVEVVTDLARRGAVRDWVCAGDRVQMADAAFRAELLAWMRFDDRHACATGDGLSHRVVGAPAMPAWLGRRVAPLALRGAAQAEKDARHLASSPAILVVIAPGDGRAAAVAAGRAAERVQLRAAALGLRTAYVNQPVEVAPLRHELEATLGLRGERAALLLRVGRGPLAPYGLRRPVEAVIDP